MTRVLEITIFAEVIMSILPSIRENDFYRLIASFNSPILKPFRILQDKLLRNSMIDFSPLFAIMLLSYIRVLF
ncbi:YggT family protein [Clostridium mucosae]|uniref:YggT family protein n=1 Tax=Clostridium sp. DSM 100503 TaxID=2963282 RepID=UPI0035BBDACE